MERASSLLVRSEESKKLHCTIWLIPLGHLSLSDGFFYSCFECCKNTVSAAFPRRFFNVSEVSHQAASLSPCYLENRCIPGRVLTYVPKLEGSPCARCHWKCSSLPLQRLHTEFRHSHVPIRCLKVHKVTSKESVPTFP